MRTFAFGAKLRFLVIPAKAGIQYAVVLFVFWIPDQVGNDTKRESSVQDDDDYRR